MIRMRQQKQMMYVTEYSTLHKYSDFQSVAWLSHKVESKGHTVRIELTIQAC